MFIRVCVGPFSWFAVFFNLFAGIHAYDLRIKTFAGTGTSGNSVDGTVATSDIGKTKGVAVDTANNLYIVDVTYGVIRKVDAFTGLMTKIAGTGGPAGSAPYGDGGAATSAYIDTQDYYVASIHASSAGGKLYTVATTTRAVRVIDLATNIITRFAGTYVQGGPSNPTGNVATSTRLFCPTAVWADSVGSVYIVEFPSQLHKVNFGLLSVLSTTGFSAPFGVWGDSNGQSLYIANFNSYNVKKFTLSTSVVTTMAGADTPTQGNSGNGGDATSALFKNPQDVWGDSIGNLYILDALSFNVRKVVLSTGIVSAVAGTSYQGYSGDGGDATSARLGWATQLVGDCHHNLYVADQDNYRMRMIYDPTNELTTVNYQIDTAAGTGTAGNSADGSPALSAIGMSKGVAVDTANNLYIVDVTYGVIRKVDAFTGLMTKFAGTGGPAGSAPYGDGSAATSAYIDTQDYYVASIHASSVGGKLYTVATTTRAVRVIDLATNIITKFAGTYVQGGPSNPTGNVATSTKLFCPTAVWADSVGSVYIVEFPSQLHKVTSGILSVLATTGFSAPFGVWGDSNGQALYVANFNSYNVKKVDLTINPVRIKTFAGADTPTLGNSGNDGDATSALFKNPQDVWGDSIGNLYILDALSFNVRKVVLSTGIVSAVAGTSSQGYCGDGGDATSARLGWATQLAGNTVGSMYIADRDSYRVRVLTNPVVAPTASPTYLPTMQPTCLPTMQPTQPTVQPTAQPTQPTVQPTTMQPTNPLPVYTVTINQPAGVFSYMQFVKDDVVVRVLDYSAFLLPCDDSNPDQVICIFILAELRSSEETPLVRTETTPFDTIIIAGYYSMNNREPTGGLSSVDYITITTTDYLGVVTTMVKTLTVIDQYRKSVTFHPPPTVSPTIKPSVARRRLLRG